MPESKSDEPEKDTAAASLDANSEDIDKPKDNQTEVENAQATDGQATEPEPESEQIKPNGEVVVDGHSPQSNRLKQLWRWYLNHKKWTLPATAVIIIVALLAVPYTRYPILALGLKRDFAVMVVDSKTGTPVSGATVTLDGQSVTTNSAGKATVNARVGYRTLSISKKYYQAETEELLVDAYPTDHNNTNIKLVATGRAVPIKLIDKISGKPIAEALIKALDTEARTDAHGMATIVLPTTHPTQAATMQADGFNSLSANVEVTDKAVAANTFALVPAGRLYFLSNLSGRIDVVSSNLDGSSRKTVLAGTGNEDKYNTVLLATRDWQYLALLSKRAGGDHSQLYVINTSNDQLTTMDSTASADFTPIGWSNHNFLYQVNKTDVKDWESGQSMLKSFSADTAKTTTIDQTTAEGTQASYSVKRISSVNIVGDHLVYTFAWNTSYNSGLTLDGKNDAIMSANADGSGKKDLRDISLSGATSSYISSVLYRPETLYIAASIGTQASVYYTYSSDNNSVTQSNTLNADAFAKAQDNNLTYLISPSGKSSFWGDLRDGKTTLFVGDYDGASGQQIASLSDYTPYGWFSDNYLLVQKSGSELYILPVAGGTALKISDYYKPARTFFGYGGGYGGL